GIMSAGLAFLLLALAGCGNPAPKLINAIVKPKKKLPTPGQKFGERLRAPIQGGNPAQAGQSINEMKKPLKRAQADMKKLDVPSSASAKKLYEVHQRFLKGQEEFVQKFGEAVKILEEPGVAAQAKAAKIQNVLGQIQGKEQRDLMELQNAQREFAK